MPSETGLSGASGASGGGGGGDASAANQVLALTALDSIYDALQLVGAEATSVQIRDAVTSLGDNATLADLATALAPLATEATQADVLAALDAQGLDIALIKSSVDLLVPDLDAVRVAVESTNTKIPASPAQDRTTAGAPSATRASDGTNFIDLALDTTFTGGLAIVQTRGYISVGAPVGSEKPILLGGTDGTNAQMVNVDSTGAIRLQSGGTPGSAAPSRTTQIGGSDGTNLRTLPIVNTTPAGSEYGALVRVVSMPNVTATVTGVATETTLSALSGKFASAATMSTGSGTVPTTTQVYAWGIGLNTAALGGANTPVVLPATLYGAIIQGYLANGAPVGSTVRPLPLLWDGTNQRFGLTDSSGRFEITNNRIPRTAHLNSATLPAAGAYTSQTAYTVPEGVVSITAYVVYTRGAAGGQVVLRPQWSNGTETAYETAVSSSVATGGTLRNQIELREILSPVVNTASAVTFAISFDVPAGATTFNLLAAEVGVTGTPGTCAITLTARYGS